MRKNILFIFGLSIFTFSGQAQTVTDIDGNVYHTVTVNDQIWMKENLKVIHYNNSDEIPNVSSNTSWADLSTGAYCNYENNASLVATYGRLYNWYAVDDSRGICPIDWHTPSDAEWMTLINYLGGENVAGGKLKETGTVHWISPNTCATNDVDFLALPGGLRTSSVNFSFIGYYGYWWSAKEINTDFALRLHIGYDYCNGFMDDFNKKSGFSIRCIKNVSSGYKDYDSKKDIQIYPNPAIDVIYINNNHSQVTDVKVYNLFGECLVDQTINSRNTEINVYSLSRGVYIVELKTKDSSVKRKLIKE